MARYVIDIDVDKNLEDVEELIINTLEESSIVVHEVVYLDEGEDLGEPLDIRYSMDDEDEETY